MYVDLKSDNGELKNIISGNEAKAQTLKSFIPLEKLKPLSAKVKKEKVEKNAKRTEKQTGKVQRIGHCCGRIMEIRSDQFCFINNKLPFHYW